MEASIKDALARNGYLPDKNVGTWCLPVGSTGKTIWVTNGSGEAPTDDVAYIGLHDEDGELIGFAADVDSATLEMQTRWHAALALIEAGKDAERKLAKIARERRPTEQETADARVAYARAAEGARTLEPLR